MTGRWFSPGTPFSSTNKTDHHDITEILLKVTLNTINQTKSKNLLTLVINHVNYLYIRYFDENCVFMHTSALYSSYHDYSKAFNLLVWQIVEHLLIMNKVLPFCVCQLWKFKQWLSSNPPISTKPKITSHLYWTPKKKTMAYDVGNSGPGLEVFLLLVKN